MATPKHFLLIAKLILEQKRKNQRIVAVVSAMGDTTERLIALAKHVHPNPPKRELDMLVTVGERISMALLAMALAKEGDEAVSYTGSQSGIITTSNHTEARILDVRPHRLLSSLNEGKIVIVAGFQGVSENKEITTLGRGGSDTSAVALGIALSACRVEFYKDVPGIFDEDPKKNPQAKQYPSLSYSQALRLMKQGSNVLHARCIQLAEKYQLPLIVKSFSEEHRGKGETRIS